MIRIVSFGYRNGRPEGIKTIIDCRGLPNPHSHELLWAKDGRDPAVQKFVLADRRAGGLLFWAALDVPEEGDNTIAFGCYGGRHRSVAMAERFAEILREQGIEVAVEHRDLGSDH